SFAKTHFAVFYVLIMVSILFVVRHITFFKVCITIDFIIFSTYFMVVLFKNYVVSIT
ncbi:hypothetical protein L9F63_005860, partial [Diploptera punctata]